MPPPPMHPHGFALSPCGPHGSESSFLGAMPVDVSPLISVSETLLLVIVPQLRSPPLGNPAGVNIPTVSHALINSYD